MTTAFATPFFAADLLGVAALCACAAGDVINVMTANTAAENRDGYMKKVLDCRKYKNKKARL